MNPFKDKELRGRVACLEEEVRELRSALRYLPRHIDRNYLTTTEVGYVSERLEAQEIMDRLGELYDFLGVDRKRTEAKTELVKTKK